MDRLLVLLGSVLAAFAVVTGVLGTAGRADGGAGPRAPAGPAPVAPPVSAEKGALAWEVLTGYEYKPGLENLPDTVKALEGTTVVVRGFLLPIVEFDDIREFCLVPNHMSCCFGMPAGIESQVHVKVKASERGLPNTNEPIEVRGVFHAVETKQQGILLSIFLVDDATARVVGY